MTDWRSRDEIGRDNGRAEQHPIFAACGSAGRPDGRVGGEELSWEEFATHDPARTSRRCAHGHIYVCMLYARRFHRLPLTSRSRSSSSSYSSSLKGGSTTDEEQRVERELEKERKLADIEAMKAEVAELRDGRAHV